MLLDEGRELVGDAPGRQVQVPVEVEVEGRVQEDRHEAGPARRLLRLGPSPLPLARKAQAGDDADHGPAPVEKVEQCARAPHRLVVGMGGDVEERGAHEGQIRPNGRR